MAFIEKNVIPLVSATKFNVPPAAVDDGAGVYGTPVYAPATKWLEGTNIKGRKLLVFVETGALTGAPTALKVGLYKGTDSSGAGAALVTGTDTEYATPAGNTTYAVEIDCAYLTLVATDFYSLGLSSNGAGTTSILAGASAVILEAPHIG